MPLLPEDGFLHEFVQALEPHSEAPAEGYLGAAIAVLSACVGPQLRTQYRSSIAGLPANQYGHVWILLMGPSAAIKKSTIDGAAKDVIRAVQRELGPEGKERLRRKKLQAGRQSDADLIASLGAKDDEEADEWRKTRPPAVFMDANEVAPLFGPGKERRDEGWTGELRQTLLTVYDGEVTSGTRSTPVPTSPVCATIFANATRMGIEERVSRGVVGSGFFGRWVPISANPSGKCIPIPDLNGASSALEPWITALAEIVRSGGIVDDCYRLYEPRAIQARAEWYVPLQEELSKLALLADSGEGDPHDGLRLSCFSRWQDTAHRLAVLHAAASQIRDVDRLQELSVGEGDVGWGITLADDAMALLDALLAAQDEAPTRAREEEDKVIRALGRLGGYGTVRKLCRSTGMSTREIRDHVRGSDHVGLVGLQARGGRGGRPAEVVFLADQWDEERLREMWEHPA